MSDRDQEEKPLALPSAENATKIGTSQSSNTVKLDHLGPLVVNTDGTLSRVSNWQNMTEAEKGRTLRVLGKRNMLRQEKMKEEEEGTQ